MRPGNRSNSKFATNANVIYKPSVCERTVDGRLAHPRRSNEKKVKAPARVMIDGTSRAWRDSPSCWPIAMARAKSDLCYKVIARKTFPGRQVETEEHRGGVPAFCETWPLEDHDEEGIRILEGTWSRGHKRG
jgi:hypothetical protein